MQREFTPLWASRTRFIVSYSEPQNELGLNEVFPLTVINCIRWLMFYGLPFAGDV